MAINIQSWSVKSNFDTEKKIISDLFSNKLINDLLPYVEQFGETANHCKVSLQNEVQSRYRIIYYNQDWFHLSSRKPLDSQKLHDSVLMRYRALDVSCYIHTELNHCRFCPMCTTNVHLNRNEIHGSSFSSWYNEVDMFIFKLIWKKRKKNCFLFHFRFKWNSNYIREPLHIIFMRDLLILSTQKFTCK